MDLVSYITILSLAVPFVTGVATFKHLSPAMTKVFLIYLLCNFLVEMVGGFFALKGMNTSLYYNIFDVLTIFFITYIISTFGTRYRYAVSAVVFSVLMILFLQSDLQKFNRISYLLIYSLLGLCAGIKLLLLMNTSDFIYRESLFWIYSGLLIYCFSTINMYLLFDYLEPGNMLYSYYKFYNLFITLLTYTFYTKAFLCRRTSWTY